MEKYDKKLWNDYSSCKDPNEKKILKNEIITNYIELVKIIATRMYSYYLGKVEFEDLVSYGILGLIDSIDRFDVRKNIKFETYASFRIRGSIIDELRALDFVPRSIRKKSKDFNKKVNELENKLKRSATNDEIAEYLKISKEKLNDILNEITIEPFISLEDEVMENLKIEIEDSKRDNSPEESYLFKEKVDELEKAIDDLKDKEKTIINLYYYEGLTYREIGEILGISESRISQIISVCMKKLRDALAHMEVK